MRINSRLDELQKQSHNLMHVFTSVAANYLPKASVLAHSLKRFHPEACFHVVLSDDMPACLPQWTAAFDTIINIRELPLNNLQSWIFKHNVLELCTAVKGTTFQYIAHRFGAERIYYFDPDIVILHPLDGLEEQLSRHNALLIPHSIEPERDLRAIFDFEFVILRHGVYNLGFLAMRLTAQGRRFLDWWADRTRLFCYNEIADGLFVDQRWMDLGAALFEDIAIVREPQYNVATWNLSHRRVTGKVPDGLLVNGNPLVFYHFSGIDRGADLSMMEVYGKHSPLLYELREWYLAECERYGQSVLGRRACVYSSFDNGRPITEHQRWVYRSNPHLSQEFPDPYCTNSISQSYYHWYHYYYRPMNHPFAKWLRRKSSHQPVKLLRQVWQQCRKGLYDRLGGARQV